MTSPQPNPTRRRRLGLRAVRRINAQRVERGITLAQVAAEAATTAKTRTCSIPTASKALSGDEPNANVLDATRRLIAAHDATRENPAAAELTKSAPRDRFNGHGALTTTTR